MRVTGILLGLILSAQLRATTWSTDMFENTTARLSCGTAVIHAAAQRRHGWHWRVVVFFQGETVVAHGHAFTLAKAEKAAEAACK
jgi:hypothetical protein